MPVASHSGRAACGGVLQDALAQHEEEGHHHHHHHGHHEGEVEEEGETSQCRGCR